MVPTSTKWPQHVLLSDTFDRGFLCMNFVLFCNYYLKLLNEHESENTPGPFFPKPLYDAKLLTVLPADEVMNGPAEIECISESLASWMIQCREQGVKFVSLLDGRRSQNSTLGPRYEGAKGTISIIQLHYADRTEGWIGPEIRHQGSKVRKADRDRSLYLHSIGAAAAQNQICVDKLSDIVSLLGGDDIITIPADPLLGTVLNPKEEGLVHSAKDIYLTWHSLCHPYNDTPPSDKDLEWIDMALDCLVALANASVPPEHRIEVPYELKNR